MTGTAGILINGRRRRLLPPTDRGLQYGDGLFETIAVRNGLPLLWERHLARLQRGSERLMLPPPDPAQLQAEARQLLGGLSRGVLKLIYTAGESQRGYARPAQPRPTRILIASPAPEYPGSRWQQGIDIGYCAIRLMPQGPFGGLKHLGRLEQVLARREVDGRGLAEGLLLNAAGEVIEATASNVFAVIDGRLLTPPITGAGVRGVMRDHILELARALAIPVAERPLDPVALDGAEELFLTNSLIGLWPVRSLEGRRYECGAVGRRLLRSLVESAACLAPSGVEFHA
jgi:4-amino-4-deoxychorismate lyase